MTHRKAVVVRAGEAAAEQNASLHGVWSSAFQQPVGTATCIQQISGGDALHHRVRRSTAAEQPASNTAPYPPHNRPTGVNIIISIAVEFRSLHGQYNSRHLGLQRQRAVWSTTSAPALVAHLLLGLVPSSESLMWTRALFRLPNGISQKSILVSALRELQSD